MNDDIKHWAEQAIGVPVQHVQPMAGSTSTTLYRLNTAKSDFVLRLFDNAGWLAAEPDLARHEAAALQKAAETSLPCPKVIAIDDDGSACGMPLLLMTHLTGAVELQPADLDDWLTQQAQTLAQIHAVSADDFSWRYFPWFDAENLCVPQWSALSDEWAGAIDITLGPEPTYRACFLHRDYHPVNLLWQGSQISGVVDWVNACRGPAGVDVAHCRANLVAMYGLETADRFLELYQVFAGDTFVYDPYWEFAKLVDGLPDEPGVYPPWLHFGLDLTDAMMKARSEAWLMSLLTRL